MNVDTDSNHRGTARAVSAALAGLGGDDSQPGGPG